MSRLLLVSTDAETEKQLIELLQSITAFPVEKCRCISDLKTKLLLDHLQLILIVALDQHFLLELLTIQEWLADKKIILILADHEEETLQLSLKLYPRFLSYLDDGFDSITLVLKKVLAGYQRFRGSPNIKQKAPDSIKTKSLS